MVHRVVRKISIYRIPFWMCLGVLWMSSGIYMRMNSYDRTWKSSTPSEQKILAKLNKTELARYEAELTSLERARIDLSYCSMATGVLILVVSVHHLLKLTPEEDGPL